MKVINYKYNNIDVILKIKNINNINDDLIQNIKDMIHKDRLFYIETNEGLTACDSWIYNTCYSMHNIKIINTYTETKAGQESIIKCVFEFYIYKNDKIIYFDKKEFLKDRILIKALTI